MLLTNFIVCNRILVAALSFLLGYEQIEDDDSEASSSDDEAATQQTQIVLSREAVYKVAILLSLLLLVSVCSSSWLVETFF